MRQDQPLISITLCTYNGTKFLTSQLDSLVGQTYSNLEIIIVDDLSSDSTWEILKDYAAKFSNIHLYRNTTNLGYQKNFEKALQYCKGDFIAISDQDDIWDLDKISKLHARIGDYILVYHDSEFIDENGDTLGMKMSDKFNMIRGGDPMPFLFYNCISGHSMMFKRDLLKDVLPFPHKGMYDHWISFMACIVGKIEYVDECLVKHRRHMDNSTDVLGRKKIDSKKEFTFARMERENHWLKICAEASNHPVSKVANKLIQAGENRLNNYFNFGFAYLIWQHNNQLLRIMNEKNSIIFSLRQIWGGRVKSIFKRS